MVRNSILTSSRCTADKWDVWVYGEIYPSSKDTPTVPVMTSKNISIFKESVTHSSDSGGTPVGTFHIKFLSKGKMRPTSFKTKERRTQKLRINTFQWRKITSKAE